MLGRSIHALHVVGAVSWVGGMSFALRPALAELESSARLALHEGALRRLFLMVWHAMPAPLLTGWVLLFFWCGGFRGAGWHIHVMHATGLAIAGVFAALFLGPWCGVRAKRAAGDLPGAAADAETVRRLVTVNFALGLPTMAVAAWGA